MPPVLRILAFLAAAALVILGIALGSNSQDERFLGGVERSDEYGTGAPSALVPITALLVAGGAAWGAALLSRRGLRTRVLGGLQCGVAAWALTMLLQTAFVNYAAQVESRFARLSISPIIAAENGLPGLLVPLLALLVASLLLLGNGLKRLWGGQQRGAPKWRSHAAWNALATAFLVVAAASALRLVVAVPATDASYGIALALLPVFAAACLTQVVVLQLRTWRWAQQLRDPILAPVTRESWRAVQRIETVALSVIAAVAAAGTLLPREDLAETALGPVLILSVRSYTQLMVLLLLAVLPAWLHARRVQEHLAAEPSAPEDHRQHAVGAVVATSVATAGAFATTLTLESALAPWVAATLPLAIHAALLSAPLAAAPIEALAAVTLWGQGNTLHAVYDAASLSLLDYAVHPGILGLWRIVAVVLVAATVTRLLRLGAAERRQAVVVPLSIAVGAAVAITVWLHLSFHAWVVPGSGADSVAVGSLIRSMPSGARAFLNVVDLLLALGGAVALARLLRPDWFPRRARPTPAAEAASTPTPRSASKKSKASKASAASSSSA